MPCCIVLIHLFSTSLPLDSIRVHNCIVINLWNFYSIFCGWILLHMCDTQNRCCIPLCNFNNRCRSVFRLWTNQKPQLLRPWISFRPRCWTVSESPMHCAKQVLANTRPYQQCSGDWEWGYYTSYTDSWS